MKKTTFLSTIFALSALTSCLDVDMLDRVEKEEGFYKTPDHFEGAISGVYSTLNDFNYMKTNWALILPAYEDAMFVMGTGVPASVSNNTHSSTSAPVVDFWQELYRGINNANEILARIDAITFDDEDQKQRIIAEAHFLRGLFFYDLVRLYGGENGIPVKTKPTTGIADAYTKQMPKDQVYEQIISDFSYAAGLKEDGTSRLPLRLDSDFVLGRVTQGAAEAFLAEAYLTQGEWENAITYANKVINSSQYKFVSDYNKLWDVDQELQAQNEMIYSVPFYRDRDAAEGNSLGSNIAYLFNPAGVMIGGESLSGNQYGKGAGVHRVQKWFIRYYQDDQGNLGYSDASVDASEDDMALVSKDYRIETTFWRRFQTKNNATLLLGDIKACFPCIGTPQDNWGYIRKFIDPQGVSNRTNENDMPRMRLSDMYLILAEAHNELGQYAPAAQAIDMVRERARMADGAERSFPKYISADREDNIGRTLSQQEFRWLVFMERGLEFAGEQRRWFDLVRMWYDENTLMYDYMKDTFIPALPKADVNGANVMSERKKYFPIPFKEINQNKNNIVQNSGY